MQTNQQKTYLAPEVEVMETVVELGFSGSVGSGDPQLPNYDEDDDVITIG